MHDLVMDILLKELGPGKNGRGKNGKMDGSPARKIAFQVTSTLARYFIKMPFVLRKESCTENVRSAKNE